MCQKRKDDWKIQGTAMTIRWIENSTTQDVYCINGTETSDVGKGILKNTLMYHLLLPEEKKETKGSNGKKDVGFSSKSRYYDYDDDGNHNSDFSDYSSLGYSKTNYGGRGYGRY